MLNYAETTHVSTIVSVASLPQDQHQEYAPDSLMSMLSTLLAHPEFARGLMSAHASFFEAFEPAPLTQDEMIEEVEVKYICTSGWYLLQDRMAMVEGR